MSIAVVQSVSLNLDSPCTITFDSTEVKLQDVEFFVWKNKNGEKVYYDPSSEDSADDSYLDGVKFGALVGDTIYFFTKAQVEGDDLNEVFEAS